MSTGLVIFTLVVVVTEGWTRNLVPDKRTHHLLESLTNILIPISPPMREVLICPDSDVQLTSEEWNM